MTRTGYAGFSLPDELVKEIDKIVENKKYRYLSRADFMRDAVRFKLKEIYESENE